MLILIDVNPDQAAKNQYERDSHRSQATCFAYQQIIDDLYCIPYTEKARTHTDFILQR